MKKIETLLNIDLGQKFDTRKALNRSTKEIPAEILEKLEAGEFNCEMISELSKTFPIFRYRTCITIHGNWGEVGKRRLGGYTNIIQNGNGSTEVKYSAIDRKKIQTLRELLSSVKSGFYFRENSSERYFYTYISTNNVEEYKKAVETLKPIAERIKGANIYGYANMFAMSNYGAVEVYLQIHVLSIPQGEEMNFCHLLTGTDAQTFEAKIQAVKEAARLEEIASEAREQERKADQERARIAAEPIFQQGREVLTAAGYLKEEKTTIEQGKIYVKIEVRDGKPIYNAYQYSKKANQKKWRVTESRSENLTFDFKDCYTRETHLTTQTGYVIPTTKPQPEKPTERKQMKPIQADGVKIVNYSEKAVAVYGNTKPIKDELKAIGARFNMFLTINGVKQAGWILPITRKAELNFITN